MSSPDFTKRIHPTEKFASELATKAPAKSPEPSKSLKEAAAHHNKEEAHEKPRV